MNPTQINKSNISGFSTSAKAAIRYIIEWFSFSITTSARIENAMKRETIFDMRL
ncbi:MAG: hypothetical protein ACJ72S_12330 [Nitrososphaeraceae archaeon]